MTTTTLPELIQKYLTRGVFVVIKQHLGEQAGLASAGASVAPAAVAGELVLWI